MAGDLEVQWPPAGLLSLRFLAKNESSFLGMAV